MPVVLSLDFGATSQHQTMEKIHQRSKHKHELSSLRFVSALGSIGSRHAGQQCNAVLWHQQLSQQFQHWPSFRWSESEFASGGDKSCLTLGWLAAAGPAAWHFTSCQFDAKDLCVAARTDNGHILSRLWPCSQGDRPLQLPERQPSSSPLSA